MLAFQYLLYEDYLGFIKLVSNSVEPGHS